MADVLNEHFSWVDRTHADMGRDEASLCATSLSSVEWIGPQKMWGCE